MVDLYDGPCREGIRGGLEQFKWDSVKLHAIRDRECYLGQSVKIGIQGKFGRFSTNDWWINKREDPTTLENEKELLKKLENELILEAIGAKPKRFSLIKGELSEAQKLELVKIDSSKNSPQEYNAFREKGDRVSLNKIRSPSPTGHRKRDRSISRAHSPTSTTPTRSYRSQHYAMCSPDNKSKKNSRLKEQKFKRHKEKDSYRKKSRHPSPQAKSKRRSLHHSGYSRH